LSILVQSVDRAARGWLRHRFSRALLASFIVLIIFGLLTFGAIASIKVLLEPPGEGLPVPILFQLFINPLIVAVVVAVALLLVIGSVAISVELVATVIGVLPRRLIAVLLLTLYVLFAFSSLEAVIVVAIKGIAETLIEALCLGFGMVFAFFISLELCAQAWWQLTVSDEGFRAASGWRPRAARILANFRRHMGLPAFLSNFGRGRKVLSLLYFLVAVLNTGIAILLFMPIMLAVMLHFGESGRDVFVFFGMLGGLLLLGFFGIGHWFARVAASRATNIYQSVREWDSRRPVIFLRAFSQDDIRFAAGTRDPLLKLTAGVAQTRTLDEILLEHASPYGPLIAIGDPADPIPPLGAARIFVKGESWHEVVTSLVDASKAIVMCPSRTEGVGWELNLIGGRGLFPRTMFLANPERSASETTALFAEIANMSIETTARQMPVALFFDPARGCRVLTARRLTGPTYMVALNMALQALFGAKGVPLAKTSRTLAEVQAVH
jgi:hypothetical protein